MRVRRRLRGFERAGRLPANELGLPGAQAKQLVLSAEWKRVVGQAIARRASALAIRRGVLEIRLHDERWREPLKSLLPSLAARLATRCPELGVRKFVLRGPDSGSGERPTALPETAAGVEPLEPTGSRVRPESSIDPASAAEVTSDRLADAMERYLDRSARRSAPRPTHRR